MLCERASERVAVTTQPHPSKSNARSHVALVISLDVFGVYFVILFIQPGWPYDECVAHSRLLYTHIENSIVLAGLD